MVIDNAPSTDVRHAYQVTRAKCGQCGRELRFVPFMLNNIMCRDCYGLERYRRNVHAAWVPEKPVEVAISDEDVATPAL